MRYIAALHLARLHAAPATGRTSRSAAAQTCAASKRSATSRFFNGVSNNQPYNYLRADSYYLVSAFASYRHRFSDKLTARFQLNISNLLDSDDLQVRDYGTYRVGGLASNPLLQLPNQIAIPDPRKFTLSATFDF